VVAGSRDQHTTLAESAELFRAAVQPKRLWVVNGARHQDFLAFDPVGYASEVVGFLLEYLMSSSSTLRACHFEFSSDFSAYYEAQKDERAACAAITRTA
jgi:hypothetical protein